MDTNGRDRRPQAGFSLVETLVAAGMVAALAAGVGQVFALAERGSRTARVRTMAALLAAHKMEQLRSLTYAHASGGAPLSDLSSDLSADPPGAGGPGLRPTPAGALDADTPFSVDYLGAGGARVDSPLEAAYIRRWSIEPDNEEPDRLLILQVRVIGTAGGDLRLVGLKGRRP